MKFPPSRRAQRRRTSVVQALMQRTSRLVVTGGGGYNPWTVGRCWALIWGTLNNHPTPDQLTRIAKAELRALSFDQAAGRNPREHWFSPLLAPPRTGPIRGAIRRLDPLWHLTLETPTA